MYDGMRTNTGSGQNSSQGFLTAWVEDMFRIGIGTALREGLGLSWGESFGIWGFSLLSFGMIRNDLTPQHLAVFCHASS